MKRMKGLAVIGILVFLPMSSDAFAQAITYDTGFQVQNVNTSRSANIRIVYYKQDGTVEASVSDTIPAGGSNTYYPLSDVPEGFFGSVAITSDRAIRAIGNFIGDKGAYYASHGGINDAATKMYAPLLMHENAGFNTWFNVQNTGSIPTDVMVAYSDGAAASCANLPPGASCTFNQAEEAHANGWVGSATISASQPVAVTVMEVGAEAMFAYNGFASGSTDIVMPLINANNGGFITGVQIMNVGDRDTEVAVEYLPGLAGSTAVETKTIGPGASDTFALDIFPAGERFVGSARVAENSEKQELVAIVNQLNVSTGQGGAYEGIDPSEATDTIVMPLIMDRVGGYFTGFNIVNVGYSRTTVQCAFSDTNYSVTGELGPGEAMTSLQDGKIGKAYVGSGICTASGGGMILGVVNEINNSLSGDSLLVYTAFNK